MHAFLFLALPVALIWFCHTNSKYEVKEFSLPLIMGFLFAVVTCSFREFFTFTVTVWTEAWWLTFIKLFLKDTFLPCAITSAAFFFFSKDEWEYKTTCLFPLLGAFYMVFLPYTVMTGEKDAFFLLIGKPLFILSLLFALTSFSGSAFFAKTDGRKAKCALMATIAFLVTLVPPAVQTMWYYGINSIILTAAGLAFLALNVYFYLVFKKDHLRKPIFMSM